MRWFNKNRCCIEINEAVRTGKSGKSLIKTDVVLKLSEDNRLNEVIRFNKNRCCIEIRLC